MKCCLLSTNMKMDAVWTNLSEQGLRAFCEVVLEVVLLGSLSNKDGDVNENGKKATGLDWQNNNFARASRFFGHFIRLI